jgi:PTS system fructose-specific IIC component/PTS system nitrogen regulatory IIA component
MLLQQVFTPGRIKVGLESEEKDELFEELVDLVARLDTKAFPRAAVLAAIHEREAKMSTGIKKGIALPHGKAEGVDSLIGAIGISRKGIDYSSLDGEPVYLVFLLVSAPGEAELHLQALKRLARLLDDPEFYTELMEADSPEQVFQTIKSFEDLLTLQN